MCSRLLQMPVVLAVLVAVVLVAPVRAGEAVQAEAPALWSPGGLFGRWVPSDEITEYRCENSKTFDNHDGMWSTVIAGPLHRRDARGLWVDLPESEIPARGVERSAREPRGPEGEIDAQEQIGNGSNWGWFMWYARYNYYRSQSLYLDSEMTSLSGGGTITEIAFYTSTAGDDTMNTSEHWIKDTIPGDTIFANADWDEPGISVWSGDLIRTGTGWLGLTLTTPFVHAAGQDLLVSFRHQDGSGEVSDFKNYRCTFQGSGMYRHKRGRNDGSTNPPNMVRAASRPDILITYTPPPGVQFENVAWTPQYPFSSESVTVSAKVYHSAGGTVDSTGLSYSNDRLSWIGVGEDSSHASDSTRYYTIPPQSGGDSVHFLIEAWSNSGAVPDSSPVYSFRVPSDVSIYDIQYCDTLTTEISPYEDSTVHTSGIVTGFLTNWKFYIGDAAGGPWHGLFVYNAGQAVEVGDSLDIVGELQEFMGLTEIVPDRLVVSGTGHSCDTTVLTIPESRLEAYEGVLVRVDTLQVLDSTGVFAGTRVYELANYAGTDTATLYVTANCGFVNAPIPTNWFSLVCNISDHNGRQFTPRRSGDVILLPGPGVVNLISPDDGAANQPVDGSLVWNAADYADEYDVYLDTLNPPLELASSPGHTDTTFAYAGLDSSRTYHWRVDAKNIIGTVQSAVWEFTTVMGNPDIGIVSIDVPVGFLDTGAVVTPEVTVHNYGDVEVAFSAWFTINDTATDVEIYNETTAVVGVSVGSDSAITFPAWTTPALEGPYATWAELIVTDLNADNDTLSGSFSVGNCQPGIPGWVEVEPIPSLPGGKAVKRGAWTTYNDGDNLIYATKGYKTTDFYAYYPLEDSWDNLTGMPYTKHSNPKWARKVPRKGSKGVADDDNYIYVTQGNNTLGFWRYGIAQDSWEELKDVPVGPDRKKVKGGTDLAYLVVDDSSYVYCLKGYSCEFYRYNTATGLWSTALAPAPKGTRGKWDKGSWLVAEDDAATTLYAHKAKYNELWSYDVAEDSWGLKLMGMPFVGLQGRKKKSKDGGSADWFESEIYALKGGNTNEFWKYMPTGDTWTELDSMPTMGTTGKKKRVKYGADIVNYAGCPVFYTLKGNKTFEWWRYGVAEASRLTLHASRRTVQASSLERTASSVLHIAPNPLTGGYATVRYSLPKAGPATLTVVDVAGRTVSSRTVLASRSGAVSLDLRTLSAGVYLVRFEADGFKTTSKLVVQH